MVCVIFVCGGLSRALSEQRRLNIPLGVPCASFSSLFEVQGLHDGWIGRDHIVINYINTGAKRVLFCFVLLYVQVRKLQNA